MFEKNIIIFTTPGDFPSLDIVKKFISINKNFIRINDQFAIIEEVAKLNKPVIISTGMAYMHEVEGHVI